MAPNPPPEPPHRPSHPVLPRAINDDPPERARLVVDAYGRPLQVGHNLLLWVQSMTDRKPGEDRSFELLECCSLFRSYQEAFRAATGLPLVLVRRSCGAPANKPTESVNPFCQLLARDGRCAALDTTLRELCNRSDPDGCAQTVACFAGLMETVVPITHDGRVAAYLKTGEVLTKSPADADFTSIAAVLLAEGRTAAEVRKLRQAFFDSPVMDGRRYQGAVFLLETFGRQLSEHLGKLLVYNSGQIPAPIHKALRHIENHLDEPLQLVDIAAHAGLSVSQFCKLFKEATRFTFTEYVNRRRIEWACRELLKPGSRVTETAYHVGFTSLSQFNRTFQRYTGETPREYRRRRQPEFIGATLGAC